MRKVLQAILFLLVTAQWAQGQRIRVEQYTVLIERHVSKTQNPAYYLKYVYHPDDPNTPWDDGPPDAWACLRYPGVSAPPEDPAIVAACQDYCAVPDLDRTGASHNALIKLSYKPTGSSNEINIGSSVEIPYETINALPWYESIDYYDTLHLVQGFNIDYFQSLVFEETFYLYEYYNMYQLEPGFTVNKSWLTGNQNYSKLYPQGEMGEWVNYSNSYDNTYVVETRIRVVPAQDVSLNLPSHDKIRIACTTGERVGLSFHFIPVQWQYQDTIDAKTNTWRNVPSNLKLNDTTLLVSGYDLFGDNYVSRLNSTINFRATGLLSSVSEIGSFTLRLSSPHITGVTKTDLNCYERHEGTIKIQFDRALLPQEKLSILLLNTDKRLNYSALNLTSLASDNTYTWPNELSKGNYYVSLLGKYASGMLYDLDVNTRGAETKYLAMNSVNFQDGFVTPETDDFESYTDYTGYSMATYTGSIYHTAFPELTQPRKINFVAGVQNNVLCKGSATGAVMIYATGGFNHRTGTDITNYVYTSTFKYSLKREGDTDYSPWVEFTNHNLTSGYIGNVNVNLTTQLVNGLKGGKYTLRVRDEVDCYAKDIDGNELTFSFTIKEPEKGITLDLYEVSPITRHDLANAQVKVQISGGTPFVTTPEVARNPYIVTFTNKATNEELPVTNTILEANKRMQSVTGLLPEGDYILRIYDAYYATNSADPGGCKFEMEIPIRKPQPLLVTIKEKKPVSCYDSTDGKLLADATGGIKLDSPKYMFKWYKVTNEGNSVLTDTDSLLDNVTAGTYLVEVTDKYNNTKASETFVFAQPSPLLLNPTAVPTNCYSDSNGVLKVTVTGGTPFGDGSYKYEWSTGARTPVVNKVLGGDYIIVVTDSNFCMARGNVSVTSPVRILPNAVVAQVTCKGKCDGQIALSATGGQGVYTYAWSTGATTATISNLCPGKYWYKVTDIGGCSESDTIEITNPDDLIVNIGPDRKICIGQTIKLDATAASTPPLTYNWQSDNGFTANIAKVAVTQAGTYQVSVSNTRGCVVQDAVVISAQNSMINTEFIVSTQAFVNESVTLVNLSQPRTDSVKWLIPSAGNVIRPVLETNDKCELIFSDTGRYAITMQAYYASGCVDDTTKNVIVLNRSGAVTSGSQSDAYLKAAVIRPNPNNGTFKVDLNFSEITRARLRLINSLTNAIVDDRVILGLKDYSLDYNVNALNWGVYMLVIDSAKGSFVYKVIIAQ
ncbi:hypothetical protein [Niastella sp. OAS944]|uniref:hypothetical protein n=1 Tax=Niastella sp. OAS944 TaxID=2664089 RepID=UPI0034857B32|nr:hypothetical protein [Chitinophagaceae bacterium OAS944]